MKYKVTYVYEGRVTVEVEADSEKSAAENREGLVEADEQIANQLSVVNVKVREA